MSVFFLLQWTHPARAARRREVAGGPTIWQRCGQKWLRRGWTGGVLSAVLFFSMASTKAQSRRIEAQDFAELVTVSDPQISPDGKSIVCRVSRWNMEKDRADRQLVLVDIASRAQRELTYERKGLSSPQWSPRGDRIAFLADDGSGKDEKAQLFVLPMNGGEARKITDSATPVEQFAWRPDGEQIAYVAADEAPNKEEIEHHLDAFEVGDNDYLQTKVPTSSHIWLVPANGGKARRLTSGSWSLPRMMPPSPPSSPISWSADGRLLAFTRQEDPHSGHWEEQSVQILNIETGEIRKLTDHKVLEQSGLFSPDGSQVAYTYPSGGTRLNNIEVYVTRAAGGEGQNSSHALDRNIVRAVWMADGKSLLLGGHDGTQTAFWLQPLNGPAKKLPLGDVNPPWLFWVDVSVGKKGDIAFPGTTPGSASELYYMPSWNDEPRKLTDFNNEIVGRALGKAERIEWKGPDGFFEDGVVLYPPDFRKDRKYPLVLIIHGGPGSASTTQFDFLGQLMASKDVVVFEPNYRGSENLGNAYRHAIWNDAGDGPGRDVMAGIEAVKKLGFVDESRIAVSGWSYGGYMTSWLIGHYHTWKVAMAGAPLTNWLDQYNLADFTAMVRQSFPGSPYLKANLKAYVEQSPMTYATQITTPTLILCDTGDFRVPITESYQLYHALKDNGVDVRFFAYPVGGHFPNDPVRQQDVYRRWVEWIAAHVH